MAKKSFQQLWEDVSSTFVHYVENVFFRLGVFIAKFPRRTILITWIFVILSCIGLLRFHIEKNPMKLWVPPESDFFYDTNWFIDKFGTAVRLQKVIITAENVLDSRILMLVYNLTKEVNAIEVEYENHTYSLRSFCLKVPVVNNKRQKRSANVIHAESDLTRSQNSSLINTNMLSPLVWLSGLLTDSYCNVFETMSTDCLRYNILDLWNNDPHLIKTVTNENIIEKINTSKMNPVTGHPVNYTKLLGGIDYDEYGSIKSAKSLLITWYTQVNISTVDLNEVGNSVGTEDWVTIPLAIWERKFLYVLDKFSTKIKNSQLFYEAGCSFGDLSGQAMFSDLDKLTIGIVLMFFYIQFSISRCNWLEIKLTLGSVGLLCVGMAYITAVSWCSIFNIPFGPVHSSLPFLLMGLGVDDMFVMNACWDNLSEDENKKSVPLKIGLMLKHAGVSIVITSFTDIVALLIGAITILPSLKSFCIYAAMGVFFIFCFSVTFYVALFTLDIKRIKSRRNGLLFCYKHKTEIQLSNENTIFQKLFAKIYKNVIFTIPGKVTVVLFTIIMIGFSIPSVLLLEQRFDPKWFIPEGSYYKNYLDTYERFYPTDGNNAFVFMGELDYNYEFNNILTMIDNLKRQPFIDDVESWIESFHIYMKKYSKFDFSNNNQLTNSEFKMNLSNFLFSEHGARFISNFKFSQNFTCGHPAPNITASSMSFRFLRFTGPEQYLPAMNQVKDMVKSTNISTGDGYVSVWAKVFANWVTDEVIGVEVERNIELALVCVMMCTFILITNIQMCFWIFICVLLTIVYVLGCMQRWGMTVDIVCCIGLELAIGLCVDYAAHVGHTFLTITEGNRAERAFKTVSSIGSAVLLGGGSTFLSLSLLSTSKAYTFQSFFKIFFLVIVFGLFNGLVFLPVVLSLIGPYAYRAKERKKPVDIELNGGQGFQTNIISEEIISLRETEKS